MTVTTVGSRTSAGTSTAAGKGVAAARAATQARATRTPIARNSNKIAARGTVKAPHAAPKTSALAAGAIASHHKPLQVVAPTGPERLSTARFAVLVFGLVLFGMAASLALNTALGSGAFELSTLQQRHADLMDSQQQAAQRLATLETPASLAKRAHALGMVAATGPAFLDLATGSVVGAGLPNPAATNAKPVVRPVVNVARALIAIKVVPAFTVGTVTPEMSSAATAATTTMAAIAQASVATSLQHSGKR